MLKQLLKGRLFGHPVHPMLVHFPTALFTTGFLFDSAGLLGYGRSFYTASVYCVGLGLGVGLLAGFFGFIDYINLDSSRNEKVYDKASWHAGIQFLVLTVFGILFLLRSGSLSEPADPRWFEMTMSGAALLLMFAGNYLGGDLVFRYGIGVHMESSNSK